MKKTTFLKALLLLIPSCALSQTFNVTVGGKAVADGETVAIAQESAQTWIVPNVVPGPYKLDPEIVIHSTIAQEVTVTAIDTDKEDGTLQNCFGGGCLSVKGPNWSESKTAAINAGDTHAAIDVLYGSGEANNPGNVIRTFQVAVSTSTERVAFTIQYFLGTYAHIADVRKEESSAAYTLDGRPADPQMLPDGSLYIMDGKKHVK